MGAAAILKSFVDCQYDCVSQSEPSYTPTAIIIECPFGSLYRTVSARFDLMGVPKFPMAGMLTFWGGVQHGYWAFNHNPASYAKAVTCPTLLMFGEQDNRVSLDETNEIFNNIKGSKKLCIYPNAGHNVFVENNQVSWISDVSNFVK